MSTKTVLESDSRRKDSNQYYKELELIYENLFYPINEKRRTYWKTPANNAKELVEYATNHKNEDKYIEIYTSINDDEVGTIRTIFLDFDLSTETRLEWELNHTLKNITNSKVSSAIANYEKNQNITDLTDEERTKLLTYLSNYEAGLIARSSDREIRSYFYKKIENGYLEEPFEDAMKTVNYFTEHGVDVTVNWSGSKGLHIRIPLDELSFTDKINNDPKLFILSFAEAIESTILDKPTRESTIDYVVLNRNKGLQRLPCSQHTQSKLYSNFIDINEKYDEAVKHLLHKKSDYLPKVVDKKASTKNFMELAIVKKAIVTAIEKATTEKYAFNNQNHENNYSNNIKYVLTDLEDKKQIKNENNTTYEHNSLKYDENGVILLNETNGVKLIVPIVSEIISKTQGQHNEVLLALEGGLGHMGITESDRKEILFNALKLADDFTKEHQIQIEKSITRDANKRGFPYLKNNYSNIEDDLNKIMNIKRMFWTTSNKTDYNCIEIHYNELITQLFKYFTQEDDRKCLLKLIDMYLNMMGIGLNERNQLLINSYGKFKLEGLNNVLKNSGNTNSKSTYALVVGKQIRLPKKLNDKLENYQKDRLNLIATQLDMQLSITTIKQNNTNIQPLVNLVERPKKLEAYKRRQIANRFLKDKCYLKKTDNGNYIFDDINSNSYIPIDYNKLGNFLSKKYPILKMGIESTELENILGLSSEFDELHNEYYLFNNGVLHLHDRKFTPTKDFKDYFTIKKMDCNYFINNELINPLTEPPTCLVDRVLREILIPNYEEGNPDLFTGYYLDLKERIGSAFNTRIKEKKFPCYYGFGDNGKDIIIEILKMVFGDRCLLATMEILQDEKADLSEYDVVIIDELDKNSFDDAIAFIKRITGGEEEGTAKRRHYSHDVFKPKNPSAFFLFTNDIPKVPLTENAFYEREDVLKLKNTFINNPDTTKKNEFKADSSLKDKISNCTDNSKEWLVNEALTAYYNRYDENGYFKGFTMAQTAEETKMIVSNTDPLSKFLRETYTIDENKEKTISNSDLRINYENYCKRNKLTCDTTKLPQTMGNTVKKVFGDIKKKASKDTLYFLKAKNEDETSITYYIDSTNNWWDKKEELPENTFDAHEQIFTRIKELNESSTPPTKKQLKEEFNSNDVEEILDNLIQAELIFKGQK